MDLPKITSNRNVSRNNSYYPFKDCTLSISLSLKLTFNMPELNSSVLMCYFDWNLKFFSLTVFKKKNYWQDMSNCKQTSFLFLPWIFNNWCFSNRRTSPAGPKVSFTTSTSSKSEVCGLVKETLQHIYSTLDWKTMKKLFLAYVSDKQFFNQASEWYLLVRNLVYLNMSVFFVASRVGQSVSGEPASQRTLSSSDWGLKK